MTSVIVNDASCLIDLRKGGLLNVLCELPYKFVVPLPVRAEVQDLSKHHWQVLCDAGMITHDLTPDEVGQASQIKKRHFGLSINDCFCIVSARSHSGILLTGDALLRKVANQNCLCVHGVLWVIDQLNVTGVCEKSRLVQALNIWQRDETVFLPQNEISARLKSLT